MNWTKKDINPEEVRDLARRHDLSLLEASIFVRRGVTDPAEIQFYLEDDLRFTHNPFLFNQMEDVVDRILLARDEEEKVLVFGDRDVDGITSTVITVEALTQLGLQPFWKVPQGDAPYGLTIEAIDEFAAENGTLIITVDCGISNFKEVEYANSLGMDVLILDHHVAPEAVPAALAIINPKTPGERYPYPSLAACGVAAKLAWALRFASMEDIYNASLCLLHGQESEGQLVIEAVKLVNLLEVKRLRLVFDDKSPAHYKERLADFVAGQEILVWDPALQKGYLRNIFGPRAEIGLTDLSQPVKKAFPALANLGFDEIKARSRIHRYLSEAPTDLDILISLFTSYLYRHHPVLSTEFRAYLDLVAMGTLADLMPLEGENRILVRQGMAVLNSTARKGLQTLMSKQKLLGKRLSASDVSWYLTPIINASGRLGSPQKAVELLLTKDDLRRDVLAMELGSLNNERKQMSVSAWDLVHPRARDSLNDLGGKMTMVYDPQIPRGITGILASRLMGTFGVPSVVLTAQDTRVIGSLRANRGFETRRFLDLFKDLFTDYGGHNAAAGFNLPLERFPLFQERVKSILPDFALKDNDLDELVVDAELPFEFLTPELINVVDRFEPFGEGHRPLVFAVRGAVIDHLDLVGKTGAQHVRLTLACGATKWPGIYWNALERLERGDFKAGDKVDAAFHVSRNFFQNREGLQMTILDLVTQRG